MVVMMRVLMLTENSKYLYTVQFPNIPQLVGVERFNLSPTEAEDSASTPLAAIDAILPRVSRRLIGEDPTRGWREIPCTCS